MSDKKTIWSVIAGILSSVFAFLGIVSCCGMPILAGVLAALGIGASQLSFFADEKVYTEVKWFPEIYWNVKETDVNKDHNLIKNATKILVCASGLRKSYDYSQLLSTLKYGSLIQDRLNGYKIGNGVCNYRHLFSIYYDDIYKSKGYLSNSYGYDNSAQ